MRRTSRWLVAGALAALALAGVGPLAAQERYALEGNRVAVHNLAGVVRVEPGSGGAVVVEVARGGADAARMRVETGRDDGEAVLRVVTPGDRVVYPRLGRSSSTSLRVRGDGRIGGGAGSRTVRVTGRGRGVEAYADLVVRVPAGRTLALHQGVGRVEVANVEGSLRVKTASAPVAVSGTRGALDVDVGSGSVRVERAAGSLTVDTGSGSVRLAEVRGDRVRVDTGSGSVAAAGVRADALEVDVGSGAVSLRDVHAGQVTVDTGSGSVHLVLGAPARRVKVDTGSGAVRLEVPPAQGGELVVDTGSGGIRVDAPVERVESRRSYFRGRLGDGEGRIEIDTGSGGVRVTRS